MWDVPRFAEFHGYELIVVENVVEVAKWSLFPAWLTAMDALGYDGRPVFLNSMVAHPTPQSRDRMYYVFWRRGNRAPDLDFDVDAWCPSCERDVAARQVWKPRTKAWPLATWGRYRTQYAYRCPSCRGEAAPYAFPAGAAIDWTIRGERIGDRAEPFHPATMARIAKGQERDCRQRVRARREGNQGRQTGSRDPRTVRSIAAAAV
jgi:DNA (cytosine-5)-methyltransferase 1